MYTNKTVLYILYIISEKKQGIFVNLRFIFSGVGLKQSLTQIMQDAGVCERFTDHMATNMAGYLLGCKADSTIKSSNLVSNNLKSTMFLMS